MVMVKLAREALATSIQSPLKLLVNIWAHSQWLLTGLMKMDKAISIIFSITHV